MPHTQKAIFGDHVYGSPGEQSHDLLYCRRATKNAVEHKWRRHRRRPRRCRRGCRSRCLDRCRRRYRVRRGAFFVRRDRCLRWLHRGSSRLRSPDCGIALSVRVVVVVCLRRRSLDCIRPYGCRFCSTHGAECVSWCCNAPRVFVAEIRGIEQE